MNKSYGLSPNARRNERGSARVKFIAILAVVLVVAYMGFQYIPVAYNSYRFKKAMDDSTEMASAGGKTGAWLKDQIINNAKEYSVPTESLRLTEPVIREGRMEVTVQYTRAVNLLPFWTYNYNFEHTSRSSTFLNPQR